MSRKGDGGPAFPQNDARINCINNLGGMSLRDYFAAHAVAYVHARTLDEAAQQAYALADEMLKERAK